jgi:superfamily II DNA or RNA helicase
LLAMVLTAEQQHAVDSAMSPTARGAMLNASDMGTGKTVVTVAVCQAKNAQSVLIIAPLQTFGQITPRMEGWMGTFRQQGVDLPFTQITSSTKGQAALANYQWGVPGVYFVGKEYFARIGWDQQQLFNKDKTPRLDKKTGKEMFRKVANKTWSTFKPDVAIFDEIHAVQNPDSWVSKTLMQVDAKFKIGLSGTPTGNSFDGAYAVCRWLWPELAEKNIYDWRTKWAEVVFDYFAVRNQRTVGEKNPGAFFNQLPCYVRIESTIEQTVEVEEVELYVDLYKEQRKVYDDLNTRMVAWIKDNPLVTDFPITKRIRQRQVTLGMPTLTEYVNAKGVTDWEVSFDLDCKSSKIDRLNQLIDEEIQDEATLIYTDSRIFAQVLVHRLNQKYGEGSARPWIGGMSKKVKDENKTDFLEGEFQFIVGVISAMGTGTDGLQIVCRNMVYVSSSDSRVDNQQSFRRAMRNGQKADKVRVWWILAKQTIDSGQLSKQIEDAIKMNKSLKRKRALDKKKGRV